MSPVRGLTSIPDPIRAINARFQNSHDDHNFTEIVVGVTLFEPREFVGDTVRGCGGEVDRGHYCPAVTPRGLRVSSVWRTLIESW